MPTKNDYYDILGVAKNANAEELKKAYRQSAMKHHPDRNPGDKKAEEKFKEATEAYQVLTDPQKRQIYDQYGHEGLNANGGFSGGFSQAGFSDMFEDIFEGFFGQATGRGRQRAARGHDLEDTVEISFEESAFGTEKDVQVRREEACITCKGDGAKPGTSRKTCSTCHGQGQVLASSGFFSISRTCPKCRGEGSFVESPCGDCRGAGRVVQTRKIHLKIPPGIENGLRMRVPGEGEAGFRGGPRGDLLVEVHVKPHAIFTREENNILCDVPVSFVQAALGAEIEVPTLTGKTTLKIPAGTQSGKSFKLKGKGIASLRGQGLGDEEVRVFVETPAHLSDKQKALLKEFAELSGEKVNPASASFMQKMKELFK